MTGLAQIGRQASSPPSPPSATRRRATSPSTIGRPLRDRRGWRPASRRAVRPPGIAQSMSATSTGCRPASGPAPPPGCLPRSAPSPTTGPAGIRSAGGRVVGDHDQDPPGRAARARPPLLGPADAAASGSRSVKWNVLPRPGSLSTQIRPPISSHQPLADRQAQAGAAVAAGGRRVGLAERLEQPVELGRRDADAGVADRESRIAARARLEPRRPAAVRPPSTDDLAGLGELERVAHQVEQHLAQRGRVAHQVARDVRPRSRRRARGPSWRPRGPRRSGRLRCSVGARTAGPRARACRPRSWRSRARR